MKNEQNEESDWHDEDQRGSPSIHNKTDEASVHEEVMRFHDDE